MGRIPWSTYSGDDVEAYAAMCIYRERTAAVRIRPSVGDGGIDVYVSLGDDHVDIYQVKKYAQSLTSKQLSDIKKSYNTVKDYATARDWSISTWHLVMPLDPTPENDQWLEGLNQNDSFDVVWMGLTVFNNWAADYPQVADYYFGDGKDQLIRDLERLAATTSIVLPGIDPDAAARSYAGLEPATVVDRLALLNTTLNAADPHYQYAIGVAHTEMPPPYTNGDYPAVVATYSRRVDDQTVTVHVLARFSESVHERPITYKGTIVVEPGSAEEREWRQYLDYGRPPDVPLTVRDLVVDMPGGLNDTAQEALLQIVGIDDPAMAFDRFLAVEDPDGNVLAEVSVRFTSQYASDDGTGKTTRGTDAAGMLSVEILSKIVDDTVNITYNFSLAESTGRHPADVLTALAFTTNFFAPNVLRATDPRVPLRTHIQPIHATNPGGRDADFAEQYLRYVKALAAIQQFAEFELAIPDPDQVSPRHAADIIRAGRLLDGETLTVGWESLTFTLNPDAPDFGDTPVSLAINQRLTVEIDNHIVDLGFSRYIAGSAEVDQSSTSPDGTRSVTFRPALGDSTAQVIWGGPESVGAALV